MGDRGKLVARWQTSLRKGTDFDSWGQVVEAVEEYQMLERYLNKEMNAKPSVFSESQKKTLQKIMACLNLRAETLKPYKTCYRVHLVSFQWTYLQEPFVQGTLLPRLAHEPGTTGLTIHIEKIGLKDSSSFLDPFITVSIKDMAGVDVMKSQDTPVATKREDQYVFYRSNVELQKPMEKLPKGTAVFFEFKHYKAKKRTISCKCFAFMEMDEIKNGPLVIELYRKPTDFRRKKLSLLTSKPLYLHLNLILYEN